MSKKIGVISDTHGLIRPTALAALQGSDLIIHAGDVGKPEVLDALRRIAPLVAVRGNIDKAPWAQALADTEVVAIDNRRIYVLHNLQELTLDPAAAGFCAVISGHSHKPDVQMKNGVLYFNPGSTGPRRFKLPIALGYLTLTDDDVCGGLYGEIVELNA